MDEYSNPARYEVPARINVADDVFANAREHPEHIAFSRKVGGQWTGVTTRRFADEVTALAAGLVADGLEAGARVALLARTSYEWMLCDYAILAAGGVTVPIYETSSEEQIAWYLEDSGAHMIFVETVQHEAAVRRVAAKLAVAPTVWRIDSGILEHLSSNDAAAAATVTARRQATAADSIATILYTSGTTGRPKGCVITHANLCAEIGNALRADGVQELIFNETKSTLLFLPLAHILARQILFAAVRSRVRLGLVGDFRVVPEELRALQPTAVLSVPRVFEKIYNTARHEAEAAGHGRIFTAAEQTAVSYSQALDAGGPGPILRLRRAVFDRLVYRKLRAAMGGHVGFAVSGGAPLGARLGHFFRGVGITVLEGYGLTETCAGGTLNLPGQQRIGTVGRPIPGCSIRIAGDGEVLLRAPFVFRGYLNNDEATAEMLRDGWCHTGDLGSLDDAGYLTITGRKKDLIVTSAGKNVAPAVLEDRLRAHWLVSQCVVVGDARPYVAALVTLDTDAFAVWKKEHGKPDSATPDELRDDEDLLAAVQEGVDAANAAVSQAEAIRRFRVLGADFTEAAGELTPTLKVRRAVVNTVFAEDVAQLYAPAGSAVSS